MVGNILSTILHVFTDAEALRHATMTCRFEVCLLSLTSCDILLMATVFDAVAPTWPHPCSGQVIRITDKRRIQRSCYPVARGVGMSRCFLVCVFFRIEGPADCRCIFVSCVTRARYIDGGRQIFLLATRWTSKFAQKQGFRKRQQENMLLDRALTLKSSNCKMEKHDKRTRQTTFLRNATW